MIVVAEVERQEKRVDFHLRGAERLLRQVFVLEEEVLIPDGRVLLLLDGCISALPKAVAHNKRVARAARVLWLQIARLCDARRSAYEGASPK